MTIPTLFKRRHAGTTTTERRLTQRVEELEQEVAGLQRKLAISEANVEAGKLAYAVKQLECDKLAAVCARDLKRVQAETAEEARRIADKR